MRRKLLITILLLLAGFNLLKAQTQYRSPGTGVTVDLGSATNWQTFDGTNWNAATVAPTGSTALPIGSTILIQATDVWANNTTATSIPAGVTLTDKSSAALGTFTANALTIANASTLIYSGTAAQTMPANAAFSGKSIGNLTINNTAGVTTASDNWLTINGTVSLTAGTFNTKATTFWTNLMTSSGGLWNAVAWFQPGGASALTLNANYFVNNTIPSIVNANRNNITTTGALTVSNTFNLAGASPSTSTGTFTLGGPLTIKCSGGSMTAGPGGIIAGTNMVTYNNTAAQTIPNNFFASNTVNNLTITDAAGIATGGAFTVGNSLTVTTLSGATPLTVNGTATVGGTLTINGFSSTPAFGQQYLIVSGTGITGTFSSLVLPNGYAGTLSYTSTNVILTVTPISATNDNLWTLVSSAGTLSPAFDPGILSYRAAVANSVSSVTVTPTVQDPSATVKVNGALLASGGTSPAINLNVGNNNINIVVTAPNGTTAKTYTIVATRYAQTDTTLQAFSPFPFGAAVNNGIENSTSAYTNLVRREHSSVTAESCMKMNGLQPTQNNFYWKDADSLVSFAQHNGKRVHGHTLVWYGSTPTWVVNFQGDSAAWENILKTHIQTVVSHFKGKVASWDVVNEAFNDDGTFRSNVWLQHLGSGYIARSYQYARQADSSVLLFYNEYGLEYSVAKRTAVVNMVNSMLAAGIPINGIGLQTHISASTDKNGIDAAINACLSTGLMFHMSELDVAVNPTNNPSATFTPALSQKQFDMYKFCARRCKAIPANQFYGITNWDVTDGDSWMRSNPDWPLPFDKNYQKKLAYQGLVDGITKDWIFDASTCQSVSGTYTDLGTNGTAITNNFAGSAMTYDDDNSSVQNIGFNFSFNGSNYTQFVLNSNGFIKMGAAAPSVANLFYTVSGSTLTGGAPNVTDIDMIYPLNKDLQGTSSTEYRVYTTGQPGSRVCTIQFKNVADKSTTPQFSNMNFQIKLYETSNIIEFVYGTWTATANAATIINSACGIKGINSIESVNIVKGSGTAWNSGMSTVSGYYFKNGNYVSSTTFNTRNSTLPNPGQTYRFSTTNNPPAIVIASPANNSIIAAGSNVTITANASSPNPGGSIAKVDFYNGNLLLGTLTTSPFSYTWSNVSAGTDTLKAVATDNNGFTATASNIIVVAKPPVVSLASPANNSTAVAGSNVTVTANASSPNTGGSIAKVDFYNGHTLLGTSATSPYSYTWNSVAAGKDTLKAVATDNIGLTDTSANVIITAVQLPVAALTGPANNSAVATGSNITITATASSPNTGGSIAKVDFYNGHTLLGTSATSPYSYTWNNVAAGTDTLKAVATDNNNLTDTSANVIITVAQPPVVALTAPANNSTIATGSNVTITATASSPNTGGSIAKVDFYNGQTLLGTSTTTPYSYTWSNVSSGTYTLKGVATDNIGLADTSSTITITISQPPVVSVTTPANNSTVAAGSNVTITANASSPNTGGSIAKVDFYNGHTLLGTSTTSPYSYTWNNVTAGTDTLKVVTTDNNGLTDTSSYTIITVAQLPVVALTAPVNNSTVAAGSNVTITATASSPNTGGSIAKVDFYNGSTLLGTSTTSPYSYTWNNVAVGTDTLKAVATDNAGLTTTSAAMNINIVPPVLQVTIPDVYALNPSTDSKNTIYIGYGPTSLTLTATAQGDTGYSYSWSNGVNTASIPVSQAGTYTVTVSSANGGHGSASIIIETLDVRCGDDTNKVQVCHNQHTICVDRSAVPAHLNHGDSLGACGAQPSGTHAAVLNNGPANNAEGTDGATGLAVYPNPANDILHISVPKLEANATIHLYSFSSPGKEVRAFNLTQAKQDLSLQGLAPGYYFLVIKNGNQTINRTIIKNQK